MIYVIPGGGQGPGQQEVSVPGRVLGRLPGTAHVPFTVAGAGLACLVWRHLALSGVMLAGPARLAAGSMACHQAVNDGEGLVQQWLSRPRSAAALGWRRGWRQKAGRWQAPRPVRTVKNPGCP